MNSGWANIDRRWIFLAMALAVAVPILIDRPFPELPTPQTKVVFDTVENLPPGSKIMLAMDYDPGSAAELAPMATAFVRHCCLKRHKMYFLTLWPGGPPLIEQTIRDVIQDEFADANLKNGEDYVNLGYKPGNEVAIKLIANDLQKLYTTDVAGTGLDQIPMTRNINNVRDMDLVLNVSAGYPGGKEWVQYAGTQGKLRLAIGCTGVQAPQMYPYFPDQLIGILAAIKGAAEYEAALGQKYEQYRDPKKTVAIKRMAPQLVAHLLMVGLIILGNVAHFTQKRAGKGAGR